MQRARQGSIGDPCVMGKLKRCDNRSTGADHAISLADLTLAPELRYLNKRHSPVSLGPSISGYCAKKQENYR